MNTRQTPGTSSPVFDTVLALLRSSLWGEARFPFQAPADTDWEAVYKELQMQTVQHLPVDILVREDPQRKGLYTVNAARNMMHWYRIMQVQQELCQQLQNAGIPCAIVKGASAACNYPKPSSRVMGDIDILVAPEHFDRASHRLAEDAEYIAENHKHKEYRKNGVILELHHAFGNLQNSKNNSLLNSFLFSSIPYAQCVSTENYFFYKLPIVEHGVSLLLHIDGHLEAGLGLRQIIDWMLFVDRELTDSLWYQEFEPLINRLGRKKLAITITRMCQIYLGLRTDITWCSDAEEQLCHDLMEYILLQGNFGKKTQRGLNRSVSIFKASKNIFSFIKMMQNYGSLKWPALQRYPFLKPFAWLYQIIRYVSRGLRSDDPLLLLRNAIKASKNQTDLMEELGASRISSSK